MAQYIITVADAADALLQEVSPSMGWDNTTPFSDFIESMFLTYAAGLVAQSKASLASQAAATGAVEEVNTAFKVKSKFKPI